jgi:hypothetical protein
MWQQQTASTDAPYMTGDRQHAGLGNQGAVTHRGGGRRARIVEAVGDGAAARGKPIVACRSKKDSVYGYLEKRTSEAR